MTGRTMNCSCCCSTGKPGFLAHLGVFLFVNTLLVLINLMASPQHLWFQWPLLGWGIGLVFHGLGALRESASRRRAEEKGAS